MRRDLEGTSLSPVAARRRSAQAASAATAPF